MARQATVRIEARSESIVLSSGHRLDLGKPDEPILEERVLVCGQAFQGSAGTRRTAAHPRIHGGPCRLTARADARYQCRSNHSRENLASSVSGFYHGRSLSLRKRNNRWHHAQCLRNPRRSLLHADPMRLSRGSDLTHEVGTVSIVTPLMQGSLQLLRALVCAKIDPI